MTNSSQENIEGRTERNSADFSAGHRAPIAEDGSSESIPAGFFIFLFSVTYISLLFSRRLINRASPPVTNPFPAHRRATPVTFYGRYKSLELSRGHNAFSPRAMIERATAPEGFLLYGDKGRGDFLRRIPLKPGEERANVLPDAFSIRRPLLIFTRRSLFVSSLFHGHRWGLIMTYRPRS